MNCKRKAALQTAGLLGTMFLGLCVLALIVWLVSLIPGVAYIALGVCAVGAVVMFGFLIYDTYREYLWESRRR